MNPLPPMMMHLVMANHPAYDTSSGDAGNMGHGLAVSLLIHDKREQSFNGMKHRAVDWDGLLRIIIPLKVQIK